GRKLLRKSRGQRCRSSWLRILPIRQLPSLALSDGRASTPRSPLCSPSMTCWSIPCAAGPPLGRESGSTCVMFRKNYARRRRRPIPTMTQRGNGANGARQKQEKRKQPRAESPFSDPGEIWRPALAAERPRAERRCNRLASYLFAIGGTVRYDGIGLPACGRKRLPPLTRAGGAPTTNLFLDSSGSGRQAC